MQFNTNSSVGQLVILLLLIIWFTEKLFIHIHNFNALKCADKSQIQFEVKAFQWSAFLSLGFCCGSRAIAKAQKKCSLSY